ncbi:YihY/virulence factor BrkB family protein [Sphingomonas piscis]|uniref:YihY/virulence factor BrkB family protein n=1 Tax=Sphingomonas piscis TaxID=2714943 RepID=A0A6G7YP11_9SPHN|nr:YihY/virulence factor BrkB family protein [Sphingomonas piscis]QIK78467.1 YihY/virulence factor BrkB family protein [Sphingomonas piscis]
MMDQSPQSPEARRKRLAAMRAAFGREVAERLKPGSAPVEVAKRVAIGVYNDGFIHAGNLAFLALLSLFPFFIVAAAVASLFGAGPETAQAIGSVLGQLPPDVADTLRSPVNEVLTARTGPLLWFGALVGLWTAASFVETIRDILRRAYGVKYNAPFWNYRLGSIAFILVAVILLFTALTATVILKSVQAAVEAWFPLAENIGDLASLFRIIPGLALFGTIYALFLSLTPRRYRKWGCRKWPGALLVTLWWMATVELLPSALSLFGGYNLTYGSLAGVTVVLLFFFVIGLGVVMGAELNAALAESGPKALKGEIYSGPYKDELEVEEPQPGEDVAPQMETGGPQL